VTPISTSVLIVGAGPVGLALACELGWRGVACIVVDQGAGEIVFPAGESISTRTMEHLRRWGISERVRESPFPQDYPRNVVFVTRIMGQALARFERDSNRAAYEKRSESPEAAAWCPKMWFDPMLRALATSFPHVDLRYERRLDTFTQDASGVSATTSATDGGEPLEIRAAFLVGCDGARSTVRRALDIAFDGVFAEGHNLGIYLSAPDLLARSPHGLASQFLTMSSRHRAALSAVNGRDLWRLSLYVQPEEADTLDPRECVRDAFGADDLPIEIIRAQPWNGHRVVAKSYRCKRAFLAGDAAHMLWPKGGFGANTGIGDAVDLGWKIAAVLEGWGGEALLESYETERRPIGLRNVEEAASNRSADASLPSGALLEDPGPAGAQARASAGQTIVATRWKEWNSMGVQLGYRYARSPIVVADGTPEPPDDPSTYVPSTWPGARAPHAWVGPERSIIDAFGRGFVLVAAAGAPSTAALETAARSAGVPLRVEPLADAQIAALYEAPLVLVRPDGHVAWRGATVPADPGDLIDAVRGARSAVGVQRV
jgi:2-polyprenyl-6-methoxyphenol hydroxylase-like FAD-dependent oxidoreductase